MLKIMLTGPSLDNWDNGDSWDNRDCWDNGDSWDTLGKQAMKENLFNKTAG